jgi:hypothetical protein
MFICLLLKSLKSLTGFFFFLVIMLLAFTTTLTIIIRNEHRDKIIDMGKGDQSFDVDLYIRKNLLKTMSDHAIDFTNALYSIFMILYGEYEFRVDG